MDATGLRFRMAIPMDAEPCIALRGQTRGNAISMVSLAALGITVESWGAGIAAGTFPGFVCAAKTPSSVTALGTATLAKCSF